jgi:integrase
MGRQLHKFTAKQVERLIKGGRHGRHGDGGGLYLSIDKGDRKRWVFLFRDRRTGKLREMGLGSAAEVTLAQARDKAQAAREAIKRGEDPIAAARATMPATIPTFAALADEVVTSLEAGWRNEKHRAQWRSTLATYCQPLADKPVDAIATADVLEVLQPIWTAKAETASRVRGRIEKILDAAKAKGHRSGENPARWRGHLDHLLPARQKLTRGHHEAMPWDDMPDFIAGLRKRDGVAALALEFAILTAARSGEVRGARWDEIDLEQAIWTVPASRMKAGREHRVPLVPRAVEIVETMAKLPHEPFVFPGQRRGSPLSDMTLASVLKRMKVPATVHGFRSSFKDWANETTSFPNELSEAALAHVTGDKVERAYRRGDALGRRRELMLAWARFLDGEQVENVVALRTIQQAG